MSNESNIQRYLSFVGFILLLFSLFFMPFRVEKLFEEKTVLIQEQKEKEAIAEFQAMEHNLFKEQMSELNIEVTKTNNQINSLIEHTAFINDSINRLMSRAVNEPLLLDTIQDLYNSGILPDELKIDSLNQLFREKSNKLIEQIRVFNQEDRDLKVVRAGVEGKNHLLNYLAISILFNLCVWFVSFIAGLILFLIGLKNWKRLYRSIGDSSIEL